MSGMRKTKYPDRYSVYGAPQVLRGIPCKELADMSGLFESAAAFVHFVFPCGCM